MRLSLCGSGHPEGTGPQILTVAMVDHAVGPTVPERHVEGIEHELCAQVVGHGPAHHAAAEGIQHDGEEQEPGPGGDVDPMRRGPTLRSNNCNPHQETCHAFEE